MGVRATRRAVPRAHRLPAPVTCAVPGCAASSSRAGDFVRFELHAPEGPRVGWVCTCCLDGDTAGAREPLAVLAVAALFKGAVAPRRAA